MSEQHEYRCFPDLPDFMHKPADVRPVRPGEAEFVELAAAAAFSADNADAQALRHYLARRYAIFGPRSAQIYGDLA